MAFTVESAQELIHFLAAHPEWRAELRPLILSDDILQMPQRLERVEKDVSTLKEDVSVLKEDVSVLKEDVSVLKSDMVEVKGSVKNIELRMSRLEGHFGNFQGDLFEDKFRNHAASWFSKYVRSGKVVPYHELSRLEEAVEAGLITQAEFDAVEQLDFILAGHEKPSGEDMLLAVETSITVNVEDVDRAMQRANILQKAGYRSRAAVGGNKVTPAAQARAQEGHVIVELRAIRNQPAPVL